MSSRPDVCVIGKGWVGRAMCELFPNALVYDPNIPGTAPKDEINKCDIAFICVPTPCPGEGALDMSIVEEVVSWVACPLLVMRSTVNPGTCDYLAKKYYKRIVMQPEYLGETPAHPMLDPKTRPFLIIGGKKEEREELIELYTTVYNANTSIKLVSAREAEIIKLTENRAIAFKVAQCQELYDACHMAGVDYYTIRDAVYGDDPRFNLWWTFVFPEKRGFNSKCIPKDIYAWCAWAESMGYKPDITRAILERNKIWIQSNSLS
jgi:UDPglucose 6-dehydrogenase